MFAKILIPATVAAFGLIAVPTADAHTHHHHHAAPTSLFASPHTHTHGTRSIKTHSHHRSLKSHHIHASVSHPSKITHTSKPLSETVAGQPDA